MDTIKSHQLLDNLFASGKEVVYERRETLLKYNHDSQITCRVIEGCVKVFSYTGSGSERIHFLYTAGEVFPIYSLLASEREEIGFMAVTKVRLSVKPVKEVGEYLVQYPYAMLALMKQQAAMYSWIVNLNLGSAEHRLVHLLMSLDRRFGIKNNDHFVINLPLTIQELADMVRLTRETTGKVLSQFEQRGYIILGRQQILVYPDLLKQAIAEPVPSA